MTAKKTKTKAKTKTAKQGYYELQVRFHSAVLGRDIAYNAVRGRSKRQITLAVEAAIKDMASYIADQAVFCPGDTITIENVPVGYQFDSD